MTIIKLRADDQKLTVLEKPVVASGDSGTLFVQVEFSDEWDIVLDRSISFYSSCCKERNEFSLIDGVAEIPYMYVAEAGTLEIGVIGWGVGDNIGKLKTTTVVKYNISEGAKFGDGYNPDIDENRNLYQEFLQKVQDGLDPYLQNFEAIVENHNATVKEELSTELGQQIDDALPDAVDTKVTAMLGATLLWTNPSPEAEFAAQTLEVDSSQYARIKIIFVNINNSPEGKSFHTAEYIEKGLRYRAEFMGMSYNNSQNDYSRKFTLNDKNIVFEKTYRNGGTSEVLNLPNNCVCVPYKIYGYKY